MPSDSAPREILHPDTTRGRPTHVHGSSHASTGVRARSGDEKCADPRPTGGDHAINEEEAEPARARTWPSEATSERRLSKCSVAQARDEQEEEIVYAGHCQLVKGRLGIGARLRRLCSSNPFTAHVYARLDHIRQAGRIG
ncbi:hypothetical protein MRX96_054691 [Rhipicephalus microplus]